MATAYVADTFNDQQVFIPGIIGAFVRPFSFNLANTTGSVGFIINDTVALTPIPYLSGAGGVMVLGYRVNIPSLDTGTSVLVSIGDNNGSAGAFQATYYATKSFGQNNTAVADSLCAFNGTTTTPVLPVQTTSNVPRSYTTATPVATTTPYSYLAFILKVTTAPNTATTTGLITGYLLMQPMGTQSVKYLNGATN